MEKCNRYPNCECYTDWEKPAKEIDPANAGIFVLVKQEIEGYLDKTHPLKFNPVLEVIKDKLEVLPKTLHLLFLRKLLSFIEFGYLWKFLQKSDLIKLQRELLPEFQDFDELFNLFFENRKFESAGVKLAERCWYDFGFSCWLQETKGLEYGNEEQYKEFLNTKTFQEYLDFEGNKSLPEIYFEKVTNEAEIYISLFNKKYDASEHKERLLQTEIEAMKNYFLQRNYR